MGLFRRAGVPEADPREAAQRHDDGTVLLDVREPDEWAAGRAPGAVHVPLGSLPSRVGELPRDREIVVICRSGRRSALATRQLAAAGFDARNMAGGMQAWARAGLPVVDGRGRPGTVA
jgi:rhodanese-related sulfurtransferase